MTDGKDVSEAGLDIMRKMFGAAMVDERQAAVTDFTRPLEELVIRYCFGEVWSRPQLDRKTRSMLTLAVLTALGKPNQLRVHVQAAINNGVTQEEIREVLLHAMVYSGVPAGVEAFRVASEVLGA
jgi:4-carboxymuconolactone decarboxylase